MARRKDLDKLPRVSGDRIRARRDALGMTFDQLHIALAGSYSSSGLRKLEQGRTDRIHPARLIELARALRCAPSDLTAPPM